MPKRSLPPSVTAAYLAEMGVAFGAGDVNALFRAIALCGREQIPMPEWAVDGYHKAMHRWWGLEATTLDAAFGVTWPKGKHLAAAKKRRKLEFAVHLDVCKRTQEGESITPALFASVGKAHGIGKMLAEEYYRHAAATLQLRSPALDQLLTQYMTTHAKIANATRKISKFGGSRSKGK